MRIDEILESTSSGATSSGAVASIANPSKRKNKRKTAMHNPNGTIKNALDVDSNILGSKPVKR